MSFVFVAPDLVTGAATDLAGIGSAISAAHAVGAGPTTGVLAAAADEVSTAIATLFSGHGQAFHALSAQAAAVHAQFVQNMTAGGAAYAGTEAANAAQGLLDVVNAPTTALLGRPLIGNGANGTAANPNGGAGGILQGNGGKGYSEPAGSGLDGGNGG